MDRLSPHLALAVAMTCLLPAASAVGQPADPAGLYEASMDSADLSEPLTAPLVLDESIASIPPVPSHFSTPRASEPLSLSSALMQTLLDNRNLQVLRVDPGIREAALRRARGRFDQLSTVTFDRNSRDVPTGSELDGARVSETDRTRLGLGLFNQTFRDGTTAGLQVDLERLASNSAFRTLNPSYSGLLAVTVRRPLLRGGGRDANLADLRLAGVAVDRARWDLGREVIDTLTDVERAYWELAFSRADLEVKRLSLDQAEAVHRGNVARARLGALPITEVLQSRAGVALRIEDVVTAEDGLLDAEKRLLRLMGIPATSRQSAIIPTDPPGTGELFPEVAPLLGQALEARPDLQVALLDLRSRRIEVARARDGTMPKVDLVGSYGLNGLTGVASDTLNQITGTEFPSWSVGLQVELPWGNDTAEGERHQRELEVKRALLSLKDLEERIELEVDEAARQVATDASRVRAARLAQDAAAAKLAAEEERFRQGLLASFQLLEFQEELAAARSRHVRAQADYRISLAELDRVTGLTLQSKGVGLDVLPPRVEDR